MAIPWMFQPILQPWVVWWLGTVVKPKEVVELKKAVVVQEQQKKVEADKTAKAKALWFSDKEVAFLKKVKDAGMDRDQALQFVTQKRAEAKQWWLTKYIASWLDKDKQVWDRTVITEWWKQLGAAAAWFTQWVSDVGQNTVGQIGRLWEKTGAVIARWLGIDESKIQAQKDLQTKERQEWFMTDVLGKDLAQSDAATYGRIAGKTAATTALAAWATAVGWWLVWAALWPATTVLWGVAQWTLAGWVGGAAWAQASTLGAEWRFATAKETAIWAALWWIGWWISGGMTVRNANKVQWLFAEKGTVKNFEKAAREWRVKFTEWLLKTKWEITPTERLSNGAKILSNKIKWISNKDPQKVLLEAEKIGKDMSTNLGSKLNKIKIGTMTKFKAGLRWEIDEVKKISDWTNSEIKAINVLKNKINKAKTADDLWKARIEWDDLFSSSQKNPSPDAAGSVTKANKLRLSVRNKMNNQLDDVVSSQWWPDVKGEFYDMSSVIEAKNNLIKNIPSFAKEKTTIAWDIIKIGWWLWAGWLGIGYLANTLKWE